MVLLSANVGFLAIQSIDKQQANRTICQIASYISIILSLAAYMICHILSRQHRTMIERDDIAPIVSGNCP